MDALKKHVDSMFAGYGSNRQIRELKREILSNLEAKADDLAAGGMDYLDAVNKAKESITGIDNLINGNTKVYINKLKLEYLQIILVYFLGAWIATIPLKILGMGMLLNFLMFIFSIGLGLTYFIKAGRRNAEYLNMEGWLNICSICKIRKAAWILWALFIAASFLYVTALQFGSNIWFSRPVHIDGPYQFAAAAVHYLLPLITIIAPILINYAPKLILKYEVAYDDENQE